MTKTKNPPRTPSRPAGRRSPPTRRQAIEAIRAAFNHAEDAGIPIVVRSDPDDPGATLVYIGFPARELLSAETPDAPKTDS
jgi:hypothetical protein